MDKIAQSKLGIPAYLAILAILLMSVLGYKVYVADPQLSNALMECHADTHAQLKGLSRNDAEYFRREIALIKACMNARGYTFDETAASKVLAKIHMARLPPLDRMRLEYRIVRHRDYWTKYGL